LSVEKKSLAEILDKNKNLVLIILGFPVLGMAIAFVLIRYKNPDNILVLGVIFFVAVQYILVMFLLLKRVENLAKRRAKERADKDSANN
jgi:hypothetical protein